MKNSKAYAKKVQKLYLSLKHKWPKTEKAVYDDPVNALICAIISENTNQKTAKSVIKKFSDYFVDWNDLRVSLSQEMVEVIGGDAIVTKDTASNLINALAWVFNKYHMVTLQPLKKMGKRPARGVLEEIDGTTDFVVDYCMLTSLQGHAIPLTNRMIEYLRSNEIVPPEAAPKDIEGFLARQISARKGYEFYALLRHESESVKIKKKTKAKEETTRKAKAEVKPKKKTTKKAAKTKKNVTKAKKVKKVKKVKSKKNKE